MVFFWIDLQVVASPVVACFIDKYLKLFEMSMFAPVNERYYRYWVVREGFHG
jgi:hypothetical protein